VATYLYGAFALTRLRVSRSAEAAARGAAEADARVEEVKKALRAEAGGPGGSLAGGAMQARGPARSPFPPLARPARRRAPGKR